MPKKSSPLTPERLQILRQRGHIIDAIRSWFRKQDLCAVDTQSLHIAPSMEVNILPFTTEIISPFGGSRQGFLQASPETLMKTIMAQMRQSIFQINHAFRNQEFSPLHQPEFTLLEWYRKDGDLENLFADCQKIIRLTASLTQGHPWTYRNITCRPDAKRWARKTVPQVIEEFCGINLLETMDDPLHPDPRPLANQARLIGLHVDDDSGWDDIFFRLFTQMVEPDLGKDTPLFLSGYPAPVATWAEYDKDDPRLSLRAELFICGVEIANGAQELTNPDDYRQRLATIGEYRRRKSLPPLVVDHDFFNLIDNHSGLPQCAGMALGLDRLVMLACGASDIRSVLWHSIDPPEDSS